MPKNVKTLVIVVLAIATMIAVANLVNSFLQPKFNWLSFALGIGGLIAVIFTAKQVK